MFIIFYALLRFYLQCHDLTEATPCHHSCFNTVSTLAMTHGTQIIMVSDYYEGAREAVIHHAAIEFQSNDPINDTSNMKRGGGSGMSDLGSGCAVESRGWVDFR